MQRKSQMAASSECDMSVMWQSYVTPEFSTWQNYELILMYS